MSIKVGNKKEQYFPAPQISNLVRHGKNETLVYCGTMEKYTDRNLCMGMGVVTYIEHGEAFDIVNIKFGEKYNRRVVVIHNHARKQIYTLKRGQFALFCGYYKNYTINGKIKSIFFAKMLQGMYVPKSFDIKKMEKGDDISDLAQEEEKDLSTFLDDIIKKTGE